MESKSAPASCFLGRCRGSVEEKLAEMPEQKPDRQRSFRRMRKICWAIGFAALLTFNAIIYIEAFERCRRLPLQRLDACWAAGKTLNLSKPMDLLVTISFAIAVVCCGGMLLLGSPLADMETGRRRDPLRRQNAKDESKADGPI